VKLLKDYIIHMINSFTTEEYITGDTHFSIVFTIKVPFSIN